MCIQPLIELLIFLIDYLILVTGLFGHCLNGNYGEKWQRARMADSANYGADQEIGFLID